MFFICIYIYIFIYWVLIIDLYNEVLVIVVNNKLGGIGILVDYFLNIGFNCCKVF